MVIIHIFAELKPQKYIMLHPLAGVCIISAITSSDNVVKNIKNLAPTYDIYRRPKHHTGRNGVLLKVLINGKEHALKCYKQPFERGEALCDYIKTHPSDRLPSPTFYPQELLVPTIKDVEWADVCTYSWVDGYSLDMEIKRCVYNRDIDALIRLAEEFKALSLDILNSPWRHGDLKTENVMVTPEGKMQLVDIDALWAPTIPPCKEIGTPNFTHPMRGTNRDEHIDDYPIALILANLHFLTLSDSPDIIIKGLHFTASEALDKQPPYQQAVEVLAHNKALSELCRALADPTTYKIPNLKEILNNV